MGSICAMSATERLMHVIEELFPQAWREQLVGKRIEEVCIDSEDCYKIQLFLKLSDGEWLSGPVIAEYIEDGGDDVIDGCVIRDPNINLESVRAGYRSHGWAEHIPEDESVRGTDDPGED